MPAVEMHAVSKTYRRRGRPPQLALDGLDLVVESGGVHGFLGPNGSGKTTTIRVLLGLVRPDAGDVRLLDRPVPAGRGYALVSWPLEVDGRKRHAGAALFDAEGRLLARSRALWIELKA